MIRGWGRSWLIVKCFIVVSFQEGSRRSRGEGKINRAWGNLHPPPSHVAPGSLKPVSSRVEIGTERLNSRFISDPSGRELIKERLLRTQP